MVNPVHELTLERFSHSITVVQMADPTILSKIILTQAVAEEGPFPVSFFLTIYRAVVRTGATGALAPVNFKQRLLSTRTETDFLCSQLKLQRFL